LKYPEPRYSPAMAKSYSFPILTAHTHRLFTA